MRWYVRMFLIAMAIAAMVVLDLVARAYAQESDPKLCGFFVGVQHDSNQYALAQLAQERLEVAKLRELVAKLQKELAEKSAAPKSQVP